MLCGSLCLSKRELESIPVHEYGIMSVRQVAKNDLVFTVNTAGNEFTGKEVTF